MATLDVTFGGLCLFVQRAKDPGKGLFVLMPREQGHHGPDEHIPTLRVETPKIEHRLSNKLVITLGDLGSGHGAPPIPSQLADVSGYAGKPVDALWLDTDPVQWGPCLAVRVEMPLGSVIDPIGDVAKMAVTYGKPRKTHKIGLVGQAKVRNIAIPDSGVTIDNIPISPDRSGNLRIHLLNVTKKDLENPKRDKHEMCEVMLHFRAYYKLLSSTCVLPLNAPDLVVDEYIDEQRVSTTAEPEEVEGIDPYRCTVGFGGPP
jgi:hypothetical protein